MDFSNGKGDRIFGAVVILCAIAYGISALNLEVGFLSDPLGSKTFPLLVAATCLICGLVMFLKPDADPEFPTPATWGALAISVVVLAGYAYALKPLGFLIPTAIAAGVLSYQIDPKPKFAVLAGLGLSIGLFVVFKYVLGLGLIPFPKG